MTRKSRWIEIRMLKDQPIFFTNGHRNEPNPFGVFLLEKPVGDANEPDGKTRRTLINAAPTLDRACKYAAAAAVTQDYRVKRLQERMDGLKAAVYEERLHFFVDQGVKG